MKISAVLKRFEGFLREEGLRLTPQRERLIQQVFTTHDHFSAETLYMWLRDEGGSSVSRATVYRTLELLERGGFVESMDVGTGERVYEHILGHRHHDHLICVDCGRIEEFHDERIERLQDEVARKFSFILTSHVLKLSGRCASCNRKFVRAEQRETQRDR